MCELFAYDNTVVIIWETLNVCGPFVWDSCKINMYQIILFSSALKVCVSLNLMLKTTVQGKLRKMFYSNNHKLHVCEVEFEVSQSCDGVIWVEFYLNDLRYHGIRFMWFSSFTVWNLMSLWTCYIFCWNVLGYLLCSVMFYNVLLSFLLCAVAAFQI